MVLGDTVKRRTASSEKTFAHPGHNVDDPRAGVHFGGDRGVSDHRKGRCPFFVATAVSLPTGLQMITNTFFRKQGSADAAPPPGWGMRGAKPGGVWLP